MSKSSLNERLRPFLGTNFIEKPLFARINYLHAGLLTITPMVAIIALLTMSFPIKTYVLAAVWYTLTGLGITAGYHRMWAHRSFTASLPVKLVFLFCGTGAFEGSVRWWCRDHRAHHKYVDTPKDPYDVNQGFWYAHMGWMLIKQDPAKIGRHDISDLSSDSLLRAQHKYYVILAPLISFGFPALIAHLLWSDAWGGFLIAGVARLVLVHHSTFCINSLAHYLGDHKYNDAQSARNSVITAFLSFGEGFHEFHHQFPEDYRNGIRWYHYDPTKWLIRGLYMIGGVSRLKRSPQNVIQMGKHQMQEKALARKRATINWGPQVETLPTWTLEELARRAAAGEQVVAFEGFVHDVTAFSATHPGGLAVMSPFFGKDATSAFTGGVYNHTTAARNLASKYRVARVAEIDHRRRGEGGTTAGA